MRYIKSVGNEINSVVLLPDVRQSSEVVIVSQRCWQFHLQLPDVRQGKFDQFGGKQIGKYLHKQLFELGTLNLHTEQW